ncbi:MAG TPA: response regulator transcription factor [Pyrinomonadaceae bacterium]|nr:response regulator transcription factor [Pyrinomonadaceae bacterium]
MAPTEIEILVADDHPIVRQGLRKIIEAERGLKVVAEATDGLTALDQIRSLKPRLAILDIDMPELDGFGVMRALRHEKIEVEVVFLTIHRDEDFFNEAINLGAKGYVLKDSALTDIVNCVRSVASGQHYVSPALTSLLLNRHRRAVSFSQRKPELKDLSPTERRVLKLIAEYKTSREIAEDLFISHRTVETHRTNICKKLEIHGNHALMKFALDHKSELSDL